MWARLLTAVIGVTLMASPGPLGFSQPGRISMQVAGPLIVTCGIVAIWEITRGVRWVAVPIGGWLLLAPLVIAYPPVGIAISLGAGVGAIGLAFVRGKLKHSYGGGWRSLLRPPGERANPSSEAGS